MKKGRPYKLLVYSFFFCQVFSLSAALPYYSLSIIPSFLYILWSVFSKINDFKSFEKFRNLKFSSLSLEFVVETDDSDGRYTADTHNECTFWWCDSDRTCVCNGSFIGRSSLFPFLYISIAIIKRERKKKESDANTNMSARLCRLPFFLLFISEGNILRERELLLLLLFVCALCTELKDPFGNHADIYVCVYICEEAQWLYLDVVLVSLSLQSFFLGAANHHRKGEKKGIFFFFRNQLGNDGPSVSCSAVHRVVMSFSSFFFLIFCRFFFGREDRENEKISYPLLLWHIERRLEWMLSHIIRFDWIISYRLRWTVDASH